MALNVMPRDAILSADVQSFEGALDRLVLRSCAEWSSPENLKSEVTSFFTLVATLRRRILS